MATVRESLMTENNIKPEEHKEDRQIKRDRQRDEQEIK